MQTNVIVGAGQAGACAAVAMRRAGFVGRIVLVGEESALPYERPPLSKAFLAAEDEISLTHFYEPATYAALEIEVIVGVRVEAIDPAAGRVQIAFGGTISFDHLVLATGSRPRRLDVPGGAPPLVLRTYGDAVRIRSQLTAGKRVVCIGAGVIGLEIASSARARGCSVVVVEAARTLMSRSLAAEAASDIVDLHTRNGVEFRFSSSVVAIEGQTVVLSDGTRLPADVVVAGIGVERNTALASEAGLEVARGIVVDGNGQTSRDHIFAAGEVAEFHSRRLGVHVVLETWRHAQDHGAVIGRNLAGKAEVYDEVPWFWSDQHGVNLQFAGDTSGTHAVKTVQRGDRAEGSAATFFLDAHDVVVGAIGYDAARDISAALRLIRQQWPVAPSELRDTSVSAQRLVSNASRLSSVPI